ncbi:MAG: hypothetical protein IKK57_03250 [Clostridia bacterium]|nr:hypothetical protein [Clostridia bacterium]
MENLAAFHARVDGFMHDSLPRGGGFVTREPLREKVGPDGRMLPFFGNTMIYDLPDAVKVMIGQMQLRLHHLCAPYLAEPLSPATLHLTLHDLLNGVDEAALRVDVFATGQQAQALLTAFRREIAPPVNLTSVAAFNMVNGSVALGFAPDTEADCAAIMTLHARCQDVVRLNYPLTPHVTLAYYKPGHYGPEMVAALREALAQINALPPVRLALSANDLHYRRFSDMNHYF